MNTIRPDGKADQQVDALKYYSVPTRNGPKGAAFRRYFELTPIEVEFRNNLDGWF
jgi:hypothetical protein